MSWLDDIINATAEAESPERYHYWAALCSISAAVRKNVYIDRFLYKLYPNIYVLLVGKSGLRKGNPVTLSKILVDGIKATKVLSGRGTMQARVKELGKAYATENGVQKSAAAYLVSGEMDSFFIKDPDAMTILTDLYDTHAHEPEWKNSTKTVGIDVLKEPCLTLLGGTNEEHFRSAVAEKDVKGGFIARTIIVFERQRRLINDLLDAPKVVPDIKNLSSYLKEISKIKGKFVISPGAKDVYRPWYKEISTGDMDDPTGTIERLGDTVLKVSMLISLAHNLSLEITKDQMVEAIQACSACLDGLKYVTMGAGKDDITVHTAKILKFIISREEHKATKRQLLTKFWGDGVDSITLDRVMETLIQAGAVEPHMVGKDVVYLVKQAHVDQYLKFKKEVN